MVFTCFHYFSVFGSRCLHVTWAPNSRWKIIDITSQCLSTKAAIRLHDPIFHVSLALKWHFLQAVCWYNIWFLIKKRGQNPISPWLLFDGIYKSWWAANRKFNDYMIFSLTLLHLVSSTFNVTISKCTGSNHLWEPLHHSRLTKAPKRTCPKVAVVALLWRNHLGIIYDYKLYK